MIALGRALRARGHEVVRPDLAAWRGARRGRGAWRSRPAPEYHVFPTRERPLKPYEAVVRATRRRPAPLVRDLAPGRRRRGHPHARARARRRAGGRAVADARPPRRPARRAAASRPTRWARGCRARAVGRAAVARAGAGRASAGCERGRDELNETRRRLGLPPLDHVHGGISQRLCLVGDASRSSSTRATGRSPARTSSARSCGSRRPTTSSCRPGDAPLVLVAPSTSQDPSTGCCAPRWTGSPTCRCACWRPGTGGCPTAALRVPAQRAAGRVGLLLAHDAALRRGRLPRRPRDGGARAGVRLRRSSPARRRAT